MRGVSLNPLVCEDLCEALDIWMGKIKTLQGQGPLSLVKNHTTLLWNAFYEERKKNVGPPKEHSLRDWGWQ